MHIRANDMVEVLCGDVRSKPGQRRIAKVLRVIADRNLVVVEGIHQVRKHVRPSRQNPQGGRLAKESPIAASNVLLYCTSCSRGRRIGFRQNTDGTKERFCRKCGQPMGTVPMRK